MSSTEETLKQFAQATLDLLWDIQDEGPWSEEYQDFTCPRCGHRWDEHTPYCGLMYLINEARKILNQEAPSPTEDRRISGRNITRV